MPPLENDLLLKALRCEPTPRIPIWLLRQAGRYQTFYQNLRKQAPDFFTFCQNAELTTQAALYPVETYQLDAAIVFSDILTIPQALGMDITFKQHAGPIFGQKLHSPQAVKKLCQIKPYDGLNYVGTAVSTLKKALCNRVPLIGFSGSPWTLAAYMLEGAGSKEFAQAKSFAFCEAHATHQLLEHLTCIIIEYIKMQIDHGADAIMLFDTWGGIFSHPEFIAYSQQYMTHIIDAIKVYTHSNVPVIIFTKGGGLWLPSIKATGCHGISLDWQTPLTFAREQLGHDIAIQGNIDPFLLMDPMKMHSAVDRLLKENKGNPGYIFNLGHGIHKTTPEAHVQDLIKHVRNFTLT